MFRYGVASRAPAAAITCVASQRPTPTPQPVLHKTRGVRECERILSGYSARHSITYTWVVRARFDAFFDSQHTEKVFSERMFAMGDLDPKKNVIYVPNLYSFGGVNDRVRRTAGAATPPFCCHCHARPCHYHYCHYYHYYRHSPLPLALSSPSARPAS